MKQLKRVSHPLQHIIRLTLFCLCMILAIILWLELNPSESITEKSDVVGVDAISRNKEVDSKEFIFPKITEFDEVIQRPLFSETRLPFVAPEPEKVVEKPGRKSNRSVKKQEQLSLRAVVITPDTQIAILKSGGKKVLQRVYLGETIDGWTLEDVTSHSVLLKKGKKTRSLELEIKNSVIKKMPEAKSKEANHRLEQIKLNSTGIKKQITTKKTTPIIVTKEK